MKKTFKLIVTLLCVAAMTNMWSCNTNQSSNSSTNNNPTSSSDNNSTNASNESVTSQNTSFTASGGLYSGHVYSFSEVEKEYYDEGTKEGVRVHSAGLENNMFNDYGTEEAFKRSWVYKYGIPESAEAKEAYDKAFIKYKEGYARGLKF